MKSLLLASALILPALLHAQQSTEVEATDYTYQQPQIPNEFKSKIEEYIFFDNNFNVVQRLRTKEKSDANLMSENDKKPVEISLVYLSFRLKK